MKRRTWLCAGAAWAAASPLRAADGWPTRPVRVLVAAPPGGVADIVARMVTDALERSLGQPVVVDYKPGASGTIAVHELLSAPADGHTFLLIQRGIASELPQAVNVRYDAFADLQPVVQLARLGLVLAGSPHLAAPDLAALVAHAKTQAAGLPYAAVGAGLLSHTTGLQFARAAGIDLRFVGYQGAAPAVKDLLGGHIPLMMEGPPALVSHIRAGTLRAYATTTPTRTAALPDVPTFAEAGFPAVTEVSWLALWSRPQVPAPVRERVRAATLKWLEQPATQARLAELGMDAGLPLTAAELARDVHAAHGRQAKVLREIGFRPS